jgi:GMP synthase-like glutamine amidotransferase
MKITVMTAGRPPAPLDSQHGTYPVLFRKLLNGEADGFEFDSVSVFEGEELPKAADLEAILITGSPWGVYDKEPWIEPLRQFVREAYEADVPMVGICFGHQIMADALGGDVRKSEKGWGIGRHVYSVTARPDFMADAPMTLAIPASHQDQVIEAPAEAEVVLKSDFTPNAGLFYGNGRALSFQPHPEFTPDFASALHDLRHRTRAGEEAVNAAIESLKQPTDRALLGKYITRFFETA